MLAPSPEPAISASPSLTREQKRQIRETFAVIEPASDLVARLFYMKSVDLDPSLGKLFKSPSRAQRRKFMAAMKVAVLSLDRLQSLQPILKLLGTRQREAGVKPSHYDTFQHAWVWTLEQSLQPRFPREAKEAWSSLLRRDDARHRLLKAGAPFIEVAAERRRHSPRELLRLRPDGERRRPRSWPARRRSHRR